EDLRPAETWQRLAAKTEKTEKRASARSQAGHASRRSETAEADYSLPNGSDSAATEARTAATGHGTGKIANDTRNGRVETDVEPANTGFGLKRRTTVRSTNNGRSTSVQPSNRTYYQERTTTTENTEGVRSDGGELPDTPPPMERAPRDRAFRQFEEANDRRATRAEQRLLKLLAADLEERAGLAADDAWRWIADAIDEAVASGSAFVAPKRIQEIVHRWSRDGRDRGRDKGGSRVSQRSSHPVTGEEGASHRLSQGAVTEGEGRRHGSGRRTVPAPPRRGDAIRVPAFEVPECGLTNHQVWSAVVDELER